MSKVNFSSHGHYSLVNYRNALSKVEEPSDIFVAKLFIEMIDDSVKNHSSKKQGLILSILRESVTLEVIKNEDGEKELKVKQIIVPNDLKDFFNDETSSLEK